MNCKKIPYKGGIYIKKTTLYLLTNLTFLFLLCIIILTPRLNAKSATDDYALHVVDAETGENVAYQIDDGYEKIISEAYSPSNSIQNIEKTDGILPRNIVGPTDDRQLVTNTSAFPYTAIGRITVTHTDGTLSYGSGAMISPTLFATAGQSGGPIYFIASDGMPYLMGVISGNSYDINIGRRIDYGLYQWLSQNGYL